jgi:hypothetical protein
VAPVPDALEHRNSVLAACHRLAIDDARPGAQPPDGLDDQRKAECEVVTWAAVEAYALGILACDDPDAVMFYLMPLR